MIAIALFLSCAPKTVSAGSYVPEPPPLPAWSGDLLAAMDAKADPCADFHAYACGGWLAATPLPADKPVWARSFSVIRDRNLETLRGIVEEAANQPTGRDEDWRKMGQTYAACMDEAKIEAAGLTPLAGSLAAVEAVTNAKSFMAAAGKLSESGVGALVGAYVEGDLKDPTTNILYLGQGGLSLPDKDYYAPKDDTGKALLAEFEAHVKRTFVLAGSPEPAAARDAAAVVAFEGQIAAASVDRAMLRDPDKAYNRLDRKGLIALTPKLDWAGYLGAMGAGTTTAISVDAPTAIKALEAIVTKAPPPTLRAYLRFHVLSHAAPHLGKAHFDEDFAFFQKAVVGRQAPEPRWKRCLNLVNAHVGEIAGRFYVEKAFAGESKAVASAMLDDIQRAFVAGLPQLSWMDDATRKAAEEKAAKIAKKIGYPDAWRDYSALVVGDAHVANVLAASGFEHRRHLGKIGKPVDKGEWYMAPQVVNAYYNPLNNEFAYPAGILQAPFFDKGFPAARNYGAIGAVMGHELSHGFDDQGRKFDGDGKLSEWWAPEVAARFEERAACVKTQFDGFTIEDGTHVKGDLTLGENIGDLGGVRLAYRAFQGTGDYAQPTNIPSLNQDQLFFVSYAQNWCAVASVQYQKMQVSSDPHSPAKFRVNGPLMNLPEFHKAFACAEGAPMRPANACEVW